MRIKWALKQNLVVHRRKICGKERLPALSYAAQSCLIQNANNTAERLQERKKGSILSRAAERSN